MGESVGAGVTVGGKRVGVSGINVGGISVTTGVSDVAGWQLHKAINETIKHIFSCGVPVKNKIWTS